MMLAVTATEDVLRSSSAAVQQWLEFGDSVNVIPGEESITDVVLTVLARVPNRQCRVVRLSRHDEKLVGPDFVLWLVSNRGGQLVGLPLLIQAKRLYPNGRFESLHKADATHPQMSVLLAIADRWDVLPFYALYQPALSGDADVLPSLCALATTSCPHRHTGGIIPAIHPRDCPERDEADLGVVLAPARALKDQVEAVGSRPPMQDISPLGVPLACLASCGCAPALVIAPAGTPTTPPPDPDLVDLALARLRAFQDAPSLEPRDFPAWLQEVMVSGTSAAELRNITREDVTDDVGTVVVVSDGNLEE